MKKNNLLLLCILLLACCCTKLIEDESKFGESENQDLVKLKSAVINTPYDTIHLIPGMDLVTIFNTCSSNSILLFGAGDYSITGTLNLMDKVNVKVEGEGDNVATIHIPNDIQYGLRIYGASKDIQVSNLNFKSQPPLVKNVIAISIGEGENILINNNNIEDVAVGISSEAGLEINKIDSVLIQSNDILNIHGDSAGWGYGIHNENTSRMTIKENKITNAGRHSIYQARNYTNTKVTIEDNLIKNHAMDSPNNDNLIALIIARSSNIEAFANKIDSSYSTGIAVLKDDKDVTKQIEDVSVHDNEVNATHYGIRINTNDPFENVRQDTVGVENFDLSNDKDRIVAFDYDGDNLDDLLCYRPGSGMIKIMHSEGDNSFTNVDISNSTLSTFDLSNDKDRVAIFDYNGDNKDDIIFYRPGTGIIYMFRSNGDGTFANFYASGYGLNNFDLGSDKDRIATFDYDGDNYDDIIFYRPGTGIIYMFRSNGDNTFANFYASGQGLNNFDLGSDKDRVVTFEYNGDNKDDIIFYRPGTGIIYMFRSNGDGSFANFYASGNGLPNFDLSNDLDRLISINYNGNDYDDILCVRPVSKIVSLYKSLGNNNFVNVFKSNSGVAGFDFNSNKDIILNMRLNSDSKEDICMYRRVEQKFYLGISYGDCFYTPLFYNNEVTDFEQPFINFFQKNVMTPVYSY